MATTETAERTSRLTDFIWALHREGKITEDVATLAHLDVMWLESRVERGAASGDTGASHE